MKTFLQSAATDTYLEVEKLLHKVVHDFSRRYPGGDYEEMLGDARLLYFQAYLSYDPSKAAFTTHVQFRVWKGLLDIKRRDSERATRMTRSYDYPLENAHKEDSFNIDQFAQEELPGRNAQVIKEILKDPPDCIQRALRQYEKGQKNRMMLRNALTEYLLDIGWALHQISETYSEIREAME